MERQELSYNNSYVSASIEKHWGLKTNDLNYIDIGDASFGFSLTTDNLDRYFLKIYPSNEITEERNKNLSYSLQSLFRIRHNFQLKNFSYPIQNINGSFLVVDGNYILVLYEFIEGKHPTKLPEKAIATILTALHEIPAAEFPHFPKETFDISYAENLLASIEQLRNNDKESKVYLMLNEKMPRLKVVLSRLQKIASLIRDTPQTLVITHGDIHGYNIMMDEAQQVYIIDWDWITLAPPERDLWFFWSENQQVLESYLRLRHDFKIDKDIVHFYMLNRFLMDLHHYVERILNKNIGKVQKELDFENILHYLNDRLPLIEEQKS